MTENSLLNYGFENTYQTLRCRLCGSPVYKYGIDVLFKNNPALRTTVKFGWCRKYTHGVSVIKAIR